LCVIILRNKNLIVAKKFLKKEGGGRAMSKKIKQIHWKKNTQYVANSYMELLQRGKRKQARSV
jgi:hypothetical protein